MTLKLPRSESSILSAICQYLRAKKYFFWRQSNTGVYRKDKKGEFKYLPSPNSLRGIPDIFLMQNNGLGCVLYGIEVKSGTGVQSEEQKQFQASLERHGGRYILARSVDDVIRAGLVLIFFLTLACQVQVDGQYFTIQKCEYEQGAK